MKIKLYIVTYKNEKDLTNNLESIFNSNLVHDLEVSIINNHSEFKLNKFLDKVKIIHNDLRPDFSTGHLSRNWNEAIINGFKNINHPDCDILIHCQDDTVFHQNWMNHLIEAHRNFSFIQYGIGDNFCSYTPEAIKNIGIWDERFNGIGYQEADFFLRAFIHNRENSSINDFHHDRVWQPLKNEICFRTAPIYVNEKLNISEDHKKSSVYHSLNKNFFKRKWNMNPENWSEYLFKSNIKNSLIENWIYYPYFELEIPNLEQKNYFVDRQGTAFFK
jgi:hypothetical protein